MKNKINILFAIPNFVTAGSQYVLLGIYNNLDRAIFNPKVLVEKHPEVFPETIPKEAQLYLPQFEQATKRIKKLAQLLKKENIDIVHSWDYKSTSVEALACRLANVKYIYTKKNNAWSKRWFAKSLVSNHIAYDNPDMKFRFFNTPLLKSKVTFIPHGVDTDIFKRLPKTQNSNFVIGCIGVLGENKNQLFILNALTKLPKDIRVEFYGKDNKEYLVKLKGFIEKNNLSARVSINDFVSNNEIPTVLSSFNILVLASKNEGLPVTLLEAMACGIPVLSSDSGGGARYIVEDGKSGFIFTSEEEFIKKTLQLKNDKDLYDKVSYKGLERVRKMFSLQAEAKAYQELYLNC